MGNPKADAEANTIVQAVRFAWRAIRTGYTSRDAPVVLLKAKQEARSVLDEDPEKIFTCVQTLWHEGAIKFVFSINWRKATGLNDYVCSVVSEKLFWHLQIPIQEVFQRDERFIIVVLKRSVFNEFAFCDDEGVELPLQWLEHNVVEFVKRCNYEPSADRDRRCYDLIWGRIWEAYRFWRQIDANLASDFKNEIDGRRNMISVSDFVRTVNRVPYEKRGVHAAIKALRVSYLVDASLVVEAIEAAWDLIRKMRDMIDILIFARGTVNEYFQSKGLDIAVRCVAVCWDSGNLLFNFAVPALGEEKIKSFCRAINTKFQERDRVPVPWVIYIKDAVVVSVHNGAFRQNIVCDESDTIIDTVQQLRDVITDYLCGAVSLDDAQKEIIDDLVNKTFVAVYMSSVIPEFTGCVHRLSQVVQSMTGCEIAKPELLAKVNGIRKRNE